jgi:hypothetical protein
VRKPLENVRRQALPEFYRRVWLLLAATLVFRFGQGLYYPFSMTTSTTSSASRSGA